MKLFTNLSIRAKLTAIISLLLWTISVFIFVYFPTQVKNEGLKDLDENARYIASSTAKWIAEASAPVDSSALRSALENALITDKLVYAVAETQEGEPIVAYKPALAERANYRHTSSKQSLQILVYKASAPIIRDGKTLGRMSIGISMEEFNKRVMDNQTTTAWISLFIFLFGVVIVISASTIITNPLRNMVETVEQIAKGNFGTRARVSTQDEVGHLAFSFNKMVGNLKSAYDDLEDSNLTLEQRVEMRTRELNEEISERSHVESALRESESRQRAVLSALPDLMLLRDGSGMYSPDPSMLIPDGELESEMTREQYAWSLMANFEPLFIQATSSGELRVKEYSIPYVGGTKHFEARIAPFGVDQNIIIVRDISDRKTAEVQLKLQSAALEAAANALVITDSTGNIIWVNPAFTQLTGFSAEEATGQNIDILRPGGSEGNTYDTMRNTIADGKVWHGELLSSRKDGSTYIEEQTVTPVRNRDDEIEHFISIKNDITERKNIERSLIAAKEEVESADKLKDAFIGNISHGIRTPLYIMIGYLNHIAAELKGKLGTEQDKYFGFIFESAEKLTKSIDLILDISRLQTGNIEFQNIQIQLTDLVEEKIREVKPLVEKKSVSLSFDNQCGKVVVKADEGFLSKCIEGLLENAVKFTKRGYIEIRMHVNDGGSIAIDVEDTGIGISEEYQSKMFQISSPNDDGAAHAFEGVGLGLALVKRYLEQIGGTIMVKSARGVGSIFTIILPAQVIVSAENTSTVEAVVNKDKAVHQVDETTSNAEKLPRLLVIEDDNDTRQFMKITLKKYYNVYTAENVVDANEIMAGYDINIVVVDVSLGGEESGLDFVVEMRKIPRFSRIPVISVTAHAFASDRDRCLAAGCNKYFSKPVDHAVLVKTMDQLLQAVGP